LGFGDVGKCDASKGFEARVVEGLPIPELVWCFLLELRHWCDVFEEYCGCYCFSPVF
jgi:hypothetical protein